MTQEEKSLLLKDLSARLSYGVVVELDEKFGFNKGTHTLVKELLDSYCVEGIKPYLRPMSSMTGEERKEVGNLIKENRPNPYGIINNEGVDKLLLSVSVTSTVLTDWLNKKHFDYRGLIPKGLAIAVTEDNNPYKTVKHEKSYTNVEQG